jgi:flagellar basal body-associated protein FliL
MDNSDNKQKNVVLPNWMFFIIIIIIFIVIIAVIGSTIYRYFLIGSAIKKGSYGSAFALSTPEIVNALNTLRQ